MVEWGKWKCEGNQGEVVRNKELRKSLIRNSFSFDFYLENWVKILSFDLKLPLMFACGISSLN
jgi:hypothetical protein